MLEIDANMMFTFSASGDTPILPNPSYPATPLRRVEPLKGARDKREQKSIQAFLRDLGFEHLPVTEAISHRAVIFVEEFTLSTGRELADALIAATACEHGIELCTANGKRYRAVADLSLQMFRP